MLHVRDDIDAENEPVENVPFSVVADPYDVVRPYWKPRVVRSSPPVSVTEPFRTAVVCVTDEAAVVANVGAVSLGAGVDVVKETIDPYAVADAFVAYALA